VGGATLLLGVVFLLVLAAQSGHFGPVPRVVAAAVLAVGLVVGGVVLAQRAERSGRTGADAGAVALVATGLTTGVLDLVACTSLYHWLSAVPALVACGVLAFVGLWLARSWRSELLAGLVTAGILLLSPLVTTEPVLGVLVVVVAGLAAGLCGGSGPVLLGLRTVLPAGLLTWLALGGASGAHAPLVLFGCVVALAAVGAVGAAHDTLVRPGPAPRAGLAVVPTAFPLLTIGGLGVLDPVWPVFTLVAAVYLVAAVLTVRSGLGEAAGRELLAVCLALAGSAVLVAGCLSFGAEDVRVCALLVSATAYLLAAARVRLRWLDALGVVLGVLALLAYCVQVVPVAALDRGLAVERFDLADVGLSLVATALALVATWRGLRGPTDADTRVVFGAGAFAALAAASAGVVATGVAVGRATGDPSGGFLLAHLVVTTAWTVVAAALVLRRWGSLPQARPVGLVLGGCALAKLFLLDLAALPGLLRVVAFLVVGAVVLAVAVRYSPD